MTADSDRTNLMETVRAYNPTHLRRGFKQLSKRNAHTLKACS